MLAVTEVKKLVEQGIPDSDVTVVDTTGTSDHFKIDVVSSAFAGKTLIEQHKMVFDALGEHLTTTIHAVDVKTKTPD